jgi:hypothetical protein
MKYKARPHLAVRSDRSRNLLCHLGLHRWSTVPRWWLKTIDEQLGPVAVERTIEASMRRHGQVVSMVCQSVNHSVYGAARANHE